jgi:molybdenum cofactor guanylyltransferase
MSSTTRGITGCILAGGKGRRLRGADKGMIVLAGRPLLVHVLDRFRPQVDNLIISANRHLEDYQRYCDRVVTDAAGDYAGPLAGIAAAIAAAETPHLATTPCDSPFIPADLVERLWRALIETDAEISVVRTGARRQPVFALLRTELEGSLLNYLARGQHKIDAWYAEHRVAEVDFGADNADFMNVNLPEDLVVAEQRVTSS